MSTPGDSSDRDPRAAPGSAEVKTTDEGTPADVRRARGFPADSSEDPLSTFLPESAIRAQQTAMQPEAVKQPPIDPQSHSTVKSASSEATPDAGRWRAPGDGRDAWFPRLADPPSSGPSGPAIARGGEPDPSPEPPVYLTDAVRVTSGRMSGSGSNNWAVVLVLLWAASVAIIAVVSQFGELGPGRRLDPPNAESAAISVGDRASSATSPTVEGPQQNAAPTIPPAVKPVEEKDKTAADVRTPIDRQVSRPRSVSGVPVSPTPKTSENTETADSPPPPPLTEPLPPVSTPVPVGELPRIGLSPPLPLRPPAPPPPAAVAATVEVDHRQAIQRVLDAYKESYDRLDAPSAALLWRGVDSRALARAFSGLSSQDLSFDQCDVSIDGPQATAVCRGELRYVRRVGSPTPQVLRGSWTIDLERATDRWVIARVNVR